MKHIVIDAGHGGTNTGVRANGVVEKEVTLALANELQGALNLPGISILGMTRTRDEDVSWVERRRICSGADLVVSVHVNWSANEDHAGPEAYYLPGGVGHLMGRAFIDHMIPSMWRHRSRLHDAFQAALPQAHGGRGTPAPSRVLQALGAQDAFLAEVLYASNPLDADWLLDPQRRSLIVCALRASIVAGMLALRVREQQENLT